MSRPFIYMNMAMTADGKITSAHGEYPHFTSDYDQDRMDELRAEADAVGVGAGTLRADNPPLQVRSDAASIKRRALGKTKPLSTVVVSRGLNLDPTSRFFSDPSGERIVATTEEAPADRVAALSERAQVWQLGRGGVDLGAMVTRLHEHGVERLLVEGGAQLNWAFVTADLFDELYITLAPALLGGSTAPTIVGGPGLRMAEQRRLELLDVHREGDELFCHYRVVR